MRRGRSLSLPRTLSVEGLEFCGWCVHGPFFFTFSSVLTVLPLPAQWRNMENGPETRAPHSQHCHCAHLRAIPGSRDEADAR